MTAEDSAKADEKTLAEVVGILLGDGCVGKYSCKKGKGMHTQYRVKIIVEMKISPAPMQRQLAQLIKLNQIKFKTREIGKGKILVRINGRREVDKWFAIVKPQNEIHTTKIRAYRSSTNTIV